MFRSTWVALHKGCEMPFMTNKTTAHDIAARYPLRRYGNVWRGECPFCRYDRSCLSIIEANGHLHVECHAGCDFRDVRRLLLGDDPVLKMITTGTRYGGGGKTSSGGRSGR